MAVAYAPFKFLLVHPAAAFMTLLRPATVGQSERMSKIETVASEANDSFLM
jgi:hypothetical protein